MELVDAHGLPFLQTLLQLAEWLRPFPPERETTVTIKTVM